MHGGCRAEHASLTSALITVRSPCTHSLYTPSVFHSLRLACAWNAVVLEVTVSTPAAGFPFLDDSVFSIRGVATGTGTQLVSLPQQENHVEKGITVQQVKQVDNSNATCTTLSVVKVYRRAVLSHKLIR